MKYYKCFNFFFFSLLGCFSLFRGLGRCRRKFHLSAVPFNPVARDLLNPSASVALGIGAPERGRIDKAFHAYSLKRARVLVAMLKHHEIILIVGVVCFGLDSLEHRLHVLPEHFSFATLRSNLSISSSSSSCLRCNSSSQLSSSSLTAALSHSRAAVRRRTSRNVLSAAMKMRLLLFKQTNTVFELIFSTTIIHLNKIILCSTAVDHACLMFGWVAITGSQTPRSIQCVPLPVGNPPWLRQSERKRCLHPPLLRQQPSHA